MTAFPHTQHWLGQQVRIADLDFDAFRRPLQRCQLSTCRGTCCHDGVTLNTDEAAHLRHLLEDHPDAFPDDASLESSPKVKTATRSAPMSDWATEYPGHFPQTQCTFLDEQSRCTLQLLSTAMNQHPWYQKPLTCWMHPISLQNRKDSPPVLTLFDGSTDPQNHGPDYPGFVPFTHCGQTCDSGAEAWITLKEELEALGQLAGRRIWDEMEQHFDSRR